MAEIRTEWLHRSLSFSCFSSLHQNPLTRLLSTLHNIEEICNFIQLCFSCITDQLCFVFHIGSEIELRLYTELSPGLPMAEDLVSYTDHWALNNTLNNSTTSYLQQISCPLWAMPGFPGHCKPCLLFLRHCSETKDCTLTLQSKILLYFVTSEP